MPRHVGQDDRVVGRRTIEILGRRMAALRKQRQRLEELNLRLHPILTMEVLLTYLHETNRILDTDYQRSMDYLHHERESRSEFD